MDISQERMEQLGKIAFINKIAEMLLSTEAVSRDNDFQTVCYHVARVWMKLRNTGSRPSG